MNSSKHETFFPIIVIVLVLIVGGSGLWIIQPRDAQAGTYEDTGSFLPVIFGNNQGPPAPTKTPAPTSTPTPTPTSTPTPIPVEPERVVFDWNKAVKESDHGFPGVKGKQMLANDDWTTPVNFAEGMLYFRAIIRDMPVGKKMRMQFCIWQRDEETGNNYGIENCGPTKVIDATSTPVTVTWKVGIDQKGWFKKDDRLIEWERERFRYSAVIRTEDKCPVSDYTIHADDDCPADDDGNQLIWAGEEPTEWYPTKMRFTVVSLAKDEIFSGWDNYPD